MLPSMKIAPLQEGKFNVEAGKTFIPYGNLTNPKGMLLSIQPFLIQTKTEVILLDTGLGFSVDGRLQLFTALAKEGIAPEQVTHVLLSHLHKDHTGGMGTFLADGSFQFHFPNAVYYLQERELRYALSEKHQPSFEPELLGALTQHPQLVMQTEDEGFITDTIRFTVCGGHTPYHQVFWVTEDGETAFYGGDNLPQLTYLQHHIAYKTDFDGKAAMEWRKKWEVQAKNENWTILLYHDNEIPVLRFKAEMF